MYEQTRSTKYLCISVSIFLKVMSVTIGNYSHNVNTAKHPFSHDTQCRAGSLRRRIKHSNHIVINSEATKVTKYNAMLAILYLSTSPRGAMVTVTASATPTCKRAARCTQ